MCILRIGYVYIPRRGNIVSSLFILIGRLAMPKICGRKATSLTSFLFLYPIIIATIWRLEWRRKSLIVMDKMNISVYDLLREAVERCDTGFAESSEVASRYCDAMSPYKRYLNEELDDSEKKEVLQEILKKFEDCGRCVKEGDLPFSDLISSHISEIKKEIERLAKNDL